MYLMVLEVVLLGIVVFIIAPILLVSSVTTSLYCETLSNLPTVILEHIPHLCRSTPSTNVFHNQTRNREAFKTTG